MSKELIYVSNEESEKIIRNLLKNDDISHMDTIKAHMRSMIILLSFIFDTKQQEAFNAHLLKFEELHQESFGFCYQLAEEFENEIKAFMKNGKNTR